MSKKLLTLMSAVVVTATAALSAPAAFADDRLRPLDRLVTEDGFPGAEASVRGTDGHVRDYTAGVGDLRTRRPVPKNGQVRIGSNTKTFTAVVVLQLAGEGKIDLNETVEHYLPGVVRGNG